MPEILDFLSISLKISLPFLLIYLARVIYVYIRLRWSKPRPRTVMLIFGSGGHTSEMLMLMKDFRFQDYQTVYFLKASSDITTQPKVDSYLKLGLLNLDPGKIVWIDIPRSREVKQSYLTSILTTLYSIYYCYVLLTFRVKRIDLLITNGPGTCIPVVYCLFLNKLLTICPGLKIIFFESFCRVYNLSLTGKLMYFIADKFVVHWKILADKYKRAKYYGRLI